ncbi:hypothetical protein DL93DRAFT_2081223 [Clavulina sp. PMI_390]|nr:hypothetical protein DL93DRAFT_2081223 [Clavulina sp. PMI_390]
MRMQIRDLEGQLAALQNALQQRDASMGGPSRGASGLLLPPQPEHSEFEWTSQHRTADDDDDIDNDDPEFSSFPRVESPHQHTHSPDPFRNPAMYDDLLQNFLTHRKRCAFECDEARFVARFNASPESPDAMHPGLVSAVLLVGYYFPPLTSSHDQVPLGGGIPGGHRDQRMEARFLQQTKDYLAHSLTSADRLPDFLRGTALLVWYYFAKGRLQEARYHAAGMSTFFFFRRAIFHTPFSLVPEASTLSRRLRSETPLCDPSF